MRTHGMMQARWLTLGRMRAMCQAHRKEVVESEWEGRRNLLVLVVERNKEKKEKKERNKEKKEKKEREKKEKNPDVLPLISGVPTIGTRWTKK